MELTPIWSAVLFGFGAALLATPVFWVLFSKVAHVDANIYRILLYYFTFAITSSLVYYILYAMLAHAP